MNKESFNLAVCQMKVTKDKKENLNRAETMISEASQRGSDMAVLPEMFNCPYENSCFPQYAEEGEHGETFKFISDLAKQNHIYIVAGSIPERDDGQIYNTSFVFDSNGNFIAKHRKMHLFDIEIQGEITFRESDTLSAGNTITVAEAGYCKIGLAICYDIRFPEMMRLMALQGAGLLVLPAAFNTVTGPDHWELLMRTRAVDNQIYVAAASPARNENASYKAYGHSMIVDPWGNVLSKAGAEEEIIISKIDLTIVDRVRKKLPLYKHRRTDVYNIHSVTSSFK